MQSFSKKLKSILIKGVNPIVMGIHYFKFPKKEIEDLASERKNTCVGCPFYVDEPVDFLKVEDSRIGELSGKMCDVCGCTLSYKLRQSIEKCEKWQR